MIENRPRGRWYSDVTGPMDPPTGDGWTTQFDGDYSLSPVQIDVTYSAESGFDPFGEVVDHYVYRPEITPIFAQLVVQPGVGWNSTTYRNGPGRTGATLSRMKVSHWGGGDAVAYNADVWVAGEHPEATHWLATPAGVILNGGINAGADHVLLNAGEFLINGREFDCSAIGWVINMLREVDFGALGGGWDGVRIQSKGATPIDSGFRIDGKCDVGLNLTRMKSDQRAAVAIREGDRIYLNAKGFASFGFAHGGAYITFAYGGINIVVGDKPVLKVTEDGEVQINGKLRVNGRLIE